MPSSRATARSDRAADPCSASWRRATSLISLVSSARARSRAVRGALVVVMSSILPHIESSDNNREHCS